MNHFTGGSDFDVLPLGTGLDEAWDRLARDVVAAPFARPGWVRAWAGAFGYDVRVAALGRNGELVAALPIVVDGGAARTATDWHVPYTEVVATDAEAVVALVRHLDQSFRHITLDFVLEGSLTEMIGAVVLNTRPRRTITRMHSPFVITTGEWDDYLAARSSKKLRDLRRRRRRLSESVGTVEYIVADGASDWSALLDDGFAVEASGWKGAAGTAVASDPSTARFYRDIAGWAASQKLLEVGVLRAGGRTVAFDLALCDGYRTWLLKTGFDQGLASYAPGQLLRHDAIHAAFERGLDSYEFTGELETWKQEWATETRPVVMIDAHRRGPLGHAAVLGSRIFRAVRVQGGRLLRATRSTSADRTSR